MKAVFFDIGETLINETRVWSSLADFIGVPQMTMFGVLGELIADRRDHSELFPIVRPDVPADELIHRFHTEVGDRYLPEDLYPDVIPVLRTLKQGGLFVGIVGNQPAERQRDLQSMDLPADMIATSSGWGVKKPSSEFFHRIVREAGCRADEVAYVGDRVDNDVVPAATGGLVPIHLVRGPWGYIQRDWPEASQARWQIHSLHELPGLLRAFS